MGRKRRYRHRIVIPKNTDIYKPPSKKQRVTLFFVGMSIILSILFYVFIRDGTIKEQDLVNVEITLKENPMYLEGNYRGVVLYALEYSKIFTIKLTPFEALNKDFKTEIKKGDRVIVQMLKSDVKLVNHENFNKHDNKVYNLMKNKKSYIDINYVNGLIIKDKQFTLPFILIGLLFIIYAFIKQKPLINPLYSIPVTLIVLGIILSFLF